MISLIDIFSTDVDQIFFSLPRYRDASEYVEILEAH